MQGIRGVVAVYDICHTRLCYLSLYWGRAHNGEWKFEESSIASEFIRSDSPLPNLPIRQEL